MANKAVADHKPQPLERDARGRFTVRTTPSDLQMARMRTFMERYPQLHRELTPKIRSMQGSKMLRPGGVPQLTGLTQATGIGAAEPEAEHTREGWREWGKQHPYLRSGGGFLSGGATDPDVEMTAFDLALAAIPMLGGVHQGLEAARYLEEIPGLSDIPHIMAATASRGLRHAAQVMPSEMASKAADWASRGLYSLHRAGLMEPEEAMESHAPLDAREAAYLEALEAGRGGPRTMNELYDYGSIAPDARRPALQVTMPSDMVGEPDYVQTHSFRRRR